MKVTQEMKIAITAAANASKRDRATSRYTSDEEKIKDLLKRKPAVAAKVRAATKRIEALRKSESDQQKKLNVFGLGMWDSGRVHINNEERFAKSGGKIDKPRPSFTSDEVIAKILACKSDAAAHKVLESYGIVWK